MPVESTGAKAEWNEAPNRLRFYGIAYDGRGNQCEDAIWFERQMGPASIPED